MVKWYNRIGPHRLDLPKNTAKKNTIDLLIASGSTTFFKFGKKTVQRKI
jgi:hypothetical protein